MIIPLADNILIVAQDDPDMWYGSSLIVRPESTKDRSDQGWVKAIGPDVKEVNVGDYVMFSPYSGVVVNVEGEGDKLIMLREVGVIGILTPPTTEVEGLFLLTNDGYIPATSEVTMLLVRKTYHKMPRVAEIVSKGIHA